MSSDDDDIDDTLLLWGIFLNATGSIAINSGTNFIKCGVWWKYAGFILFGVGNCMTFGSMSLGPGSLLSAVSAIQFVSNVFWSFILFGERPTARVMSGTIVIILADVTIVLCSPGTSSSLSALALIQLFWRGTNRRIFVLGCWLLFSFLVVLFGCLYRRTPLPVCCPCCFKWPVISDDDLEVLNRNALPAVIFTMLSAVIGAQSVIVGKVLALELSAVFQNTGSSRNYVRDIAIAIVLSVACITLWLVQLKRGLKFFRGPYVIPLQQACWILWSIVSSLVTFEEYEGFTTYTSIGFIVGVLLLFLGVALMARPQLQVNEESMRNIMDLNSFRSCQSTASADNMDYVGMFGIPISSFKPPLGSNMSLPDS